MSAAHFLYCFHTRERFQLRIVVFIEWTRTHTSQPTISKEQLTYSTCTYAYALFLLVVCLLNEVGPQQEVKCQNRTERFAVPTKGMHTKVNWADPAEEKTNLLVRVKAHSHQQQRTRTYDDQAEEWKVTKARTRGRRSANVVNSLKGPDVKVNEKENSAACSS